MATSSPTNLTENISKEHEPASTPCSDAHPCGQHEGQWFPHHILPRVISAQQHFVARPSDIFLCSFPKSGTTWLKALMFCIATRQHYPQLADHPLLSANSHTCVPFLEEITHAGEGGSEVAASFESNETSFRLLSSHMAHWILPESIRTSSPGCRIVYVCREPKDTLVSLWKFAMGIDGKPIGQEEFMEPFLKGIGTYGPLWDHVLGYWKESVEHPDKVMFLKYEEIKRDERGTLIRLANFMGTPFSQEEEEGGLVEKIIQLCSFKTMSKLEVYQSGTTKALAKVSISNKLFLRRGEVGDWQNHLTPEMAKKIDDMTAAKFHGSGLTFGDENSPE